MFEDITVTSTYFPIFFLPFLVTTAEMISVSENVYYRVGVENKNNSEAYRVVFLVFMFCTHVFTFTFLS